MLWRRWGATGQQSELRKRELELQALSLSVVTRIRMFSHLLICASHILVSSLGGLG